jgi:hypothetical protein
MSPPVDPTSLDAANQLFDFSSRWLLVVGAVAAATAFAAFALAVIQWRSDRVRERHADWRIASLEKEAAEARRETSRASERIATLQKEAEGLKAQAEADRLARIKIEEKLAPRSLSGEQQKAIVESVRKFAPQKFQLVMYQDDQEVSQLAQVIVKTLVAAGWTGVKQEGWLAMQLEIGVRIEFSPDKERDLSPAAAALAAALNAVGIATAWGARPKLDSTDQLKIRIGKKP